MVLHMSSVPDNSEGKREREEEEDEEDEEELGGMVRGWRRKKGCRMNSQLRRGSRVFWMSCAKQSRRNME